MSDAQPMVYVVDDDPFVRSSLESLIWAAGWKAASFASASEFLALTRDASPSCLVLDVVLPDINGLEVQDQIAARSDGLPVVFITGHADVPMTVQAMKGGAVDFFTKPFYGDAILAAIELAIERSRAAIEKQAELDVLIRRHALLSCRERDVMRLVVLGYLNKQVADNLCISEITVKAHRGHAMRKMQARSFADLVKMAARLDEGIAHGTQ